MLRRRVPCALLAALLLACAVAPPAAAAPAGRTILPRRTAEAIHAALGRTLDRAAARVSGERGQRLEITSRMLDPRNHSFFAFRGRVALPWPEKIKPPVWHIAGNGRLALDLHAEPAGRNAGWVVYEFSGDLLLDMDEAVLDMAKLVVGMAVSAAVEKVALSMVEFFGRVDGGALATAGLRTVRDLAASMTVEGHQAVVRRAWAFRETHSVLADLATGIRNGNALSYFLFHLVAVGLKSGMSIAGDSLGAIVGTLLVPGVGTLAGGLIGRAGRLIITELVIDRVGVEWFMRVQIGRLLKAASASSAPGGAEAARREEAERRILDKVLAEMRLGQYAKFDALVSVVRGKKAAAAPLSGVVRGINRALQFAIMERGDLEAARKYQQLRVAAISAGLERAFGY